MEAPDERSARQVAQSATLPYHLLRIPLDRGQVFAISAPKDISADDVDFVLVTLASWRKRLIGSPPPPLTIEPEEPWALNGGR